MGDNQNNHDFMNLGRAFILACYQHYACEINRSAIVKRFRELRKELGTGKLADLKFVSYAPKLNIARDHAMHSVKSYKDMVGSNEEPFYICARVIDLGEGYPGIGKRVARALDKGETKLNGFLEKLLD